MRRLYFTESERSLHINTLEYYTAVEILSSSYLQKLSKRVDLFIDNQTALSWLENQKVPSSVTRDSNFLESTTKKLIQSLALYESVSFHRVASK